MPFGRFRNIENSYSLYEAFLKTIGFFGGTFDPIHFGHINLAIQLFELHKLDQILFCPAYCSPFKEASPPSATPQQRLEMVRLAIEEIPHFRLSAYEIDRGDLSYTIDTLQHLQGESRGSVKFRLLLSEEEITHLDRWKDVQRLIKLAPPLIGCRSSSAFEGPLAQSLRTAFTQTHMMEISSTEIRARLRKGLYCGHLVPRKTLDYIRENEIYPD